MGHLSNPISTRLNISRVWNSIWSSYNLNNNYYYLLNNNLELITILDYLLSGKYNNFFLKKGYIFFKYNIIKLWNLNIILFFIYDNSINDILTLLYNNVKRNIKNKNFKIKKKIYKTKINKYICKLKKIKNNISYINIFKYKFKNYNLLKKKKTIEKKKVFYNTKFSKKLNFFIKLNFLENLNLFSFFQRTNLKYLYFNKKNKFFFKNKIKIKFNKKNKFFIEWNRIKKNKSKYIFKKIYFLKNKKKLIRKYLNHLKLSNVNNYQLY
jgi:hypothetical protein